MLRLVELDAQSADPIETLHIKLDQLRAVRCEANQNTLRVVPATENGFEVILERLGGSQFRVYFNGWHEESEDPQEALDCAAFGLTSLCRLKAISRGDFEYNWTLQYQEAGEWLNHSTTGLMLFPFWRSKETHIRQNRTLNRLLPQH